MLTIENIYNFRVLERHSEGLYINNQWIFAIAPNKGSEYYTIITAIKSDMIPVPLEMVIAHKHKKLKVPMIPYKNDARWS